MANENINTDLTTELTGFRLAWRRIDEAPYDDAAHTAAIQAALNLYDRLEKMEGERAHAGRG